MIERLKDHVATWEVKPIHASIFGSAARGDEDTESDIDILVIRPKDVEEENEPWRSQIDSLAAAFHSWTGNHAGIAEIAERDLARLRRAHPPVIKDVMADGITLVGEEPSSIFRKRHCGGAGSEISLHPGTEAHPLRSGSSRTLALAGHRIHGNRLIEPRSSGALTRV